MAQVSTYVLREIFPEDAAAVAKLEARIHRVEACSGRDRIKWLLEKSEGRGANFSIGLFHGLRLVGYVLAFLDDSPCYPPSTLTCGVGETAACDVPGIHVVDIAVQPRHTQAAARLLRGFCYRMRLRSDLAGRPLYGFCSDAWLNRFKRLRRLFDFLNLAPVASISLPSPQEPLRYWVLALCLRPARRRIPSLPQSLRGIECFSHGCGDWTIGVLNNYQAWEALEPFWDEFLTQTPAANGFHSFPYLRAWWQHLGWAGELYIIVVLNNGQPVAIAPMEITKVPWLFGSLRRLTFLGLNLEMDRPTVLAAETNVHASTLIVDYLVRRKGDWDFMVLFEQFPDSSVVKNWSSQLNEAGFLVSMTPGPESSWVDIQGTWKEYLDGRNRSIRKSIRRKVDALNKAGELRFEVVRPETETGLLQRYLEVERRSWKPAAGLGAGKTSGHISFYRDVIERFAAWGGVKFAFLYLDEVPIAATFGLTWHDRFYSLHIAHDERYARFSPGYVLTAFELEEAFAEGSCSVFDFLAGFLANKGGWATHSIRTHSLFVNQATWKGKAYHWWLFSLKPFLKGALRRCGWLERAMHWRKRWQLLK